MKMVSYAQNGEDVMLSRALRDVGHGFYVDVGAAGPTEHSVTRTFYDRGWHGINVEPTQRFFDELRAARPRDVNVQAALDEAPGEQTFYAFEGTGLSTLETGVAEGHKPGGWPMTPTVVQTRTLADLCAEHAPAVIHFLKIDVEGAEARVLRGADFARFRPWIVVVEATRPMSPEPDYAGWEPILSGAGYEFVWFDGLNRFYLAREKAAELRRHFVVPINYFDDFDLHNQLAERLEAEARTLRDRTEDAEVAARRAEDGARRADAEAAGLGARLAEVAHRLWECETALEAQRADYEARLSAQHEQTHHRRLAQEGAEAAVADLQARLRFLERRAAPGLGMDAVAEPGRPAGLRGVLAALYGATLRPVVRPAMWRTRTFLLAGLRTEQLTLHEEQREALGQVAARVGELRHDMEAAVAAIRVSLDRPVVVPTSPVPPPAREQTREEGAVVELAALARSMEAALMTLAVTATRRTAG